MGHTQYNHFWYFGNGCGLEFNSANLNFVSGSMHTPEGCASIGLNGAIGFYTNGEKIWGYNHQLMTNGTGIGGNKNSCQSAVIVDIAAAKDNWYIFTTDAGGGPNGIRHTLINYKGGAGGSIFFKNKPLGKQVAEKLTTAPHCDGMGTWVLTHEWNSDRYLSYLVGKDSLDPNPVISKVGQYIGGSSYNAKGCMKATLTGTYVAAAITEKNAIEIYEFDNIKGTLSNGVFINNITAPYGVEFSGNEERLYVSTLDGKIYQFDISNYNQTDIENSKQLVTSASFIIGSLQLGVDHRIYVAQDMQQFVGRINYPNSPASMCDYQEHAKHLGAHLCEAGLPQFIHEREIPELVKEGECLGDTAKTKLTHIVTPDSIVWHFNDTDYPDSTVTGEIAEHYYDSIGPYEAFAVMYLCDTTDTTFFSYKFKVPPSVEIIDSIVQCDNISDSIRPISTYYVETYQWSTGSTERATLINQSGEYILTVENICGTFSDTCFVTLNPSPNVQLHDTLMCSGDTIHYSIDTSYSSVFWQDTLEQNHYSTGDPGVYSYTITNEYNCTQKGYVSVQIQPPPEVDLGNDFVLCDGHSVLLDGGSGPNFLWQDGSTSSEFEVKTEGVYYVITSNMCGSTTDSVHVKIDACDILLYVPTAFTPNGDGLNDVFKTKSQYVSWIELIVYDRWGKMVFKSNDINHGWDGRHKGSNCMSGVYTWTVRYKGFTEHIFTELGSVTLIR